MKILYSFFILFSITCCKIFKPSPKYVEYNTNYIEDIYIPKLDPLDVYPNLQFVNENELIYFSKNASKLGVFNLKSKKLITYNLHNTSFKIPLQSVSYSNIDDSTVLVLVDSYNPFSDSTLFFINIKTGAKSYPFNIKAPNLFTEDLWPKDSWDKEPSAELYVKDKIIGLSSPFYNKTKGFALATLAPNKINSKDPCYTINNNAIQIFYENKQVSKTLPIYFSMINSKFKDSMNQNSELGNYEKYLPKIIDYDSNNVLINFKLSDISILLNKTTLNFKKYNTFPSFLKYNKEYELTINSKEQISVYGYLNTITNLNCDYMYRRMRIPTISSDSPFSFVDHTRYIVYNKKPYPKAIGIISDLGYGIETIDDKGNIYCLNREISNLDSNYYLVHKFKIIEKGEIIGFYQPKVSATLKSKSLSINSYLDSLNTKIKNNDTIAIVFTSNVCPSCIQLTGSSISVCQFNKKLNKPIILVSSGPFSNHTFMENYNIKNAPNIYFDNNYLFKLVKDTRQDMGWFIKKNSVFTYEELGFSKLNYLLNFINQDYSLSGEYCSPIKLE